MTLHIDLTALGLEEEANQEGTRHKKMPEHYDREALDIALAKQGILFGRVRELLHAVAMHGKARKVDGIIVCEITTAALSEVLGCSDRTVIRTNASLKAASIPWVTIESGQHGHRYQIDAYRPPDTGVTNPCQTPDRPLTTGCQTPAKIEDGTEGATRPQASPEQELPTEVLAEVVAEREQAREGEAATATSSSEFDLHEFIRGELKAAGLKQLVDYALDLAVGNTKAAMPDEETQRQFVRDKIAKVVQEGYSMRTVRNMLTGDHDSWLKARADREIIFGSLSTPATPKQKPTAKPSNAFTSPGFDERLEEAIKHGTRNTKNTPKVDYAAQNREREARNVHEWLIKQGTIPADQPFSLEWLEQAGWME